MFNIYIIEDNIEFAKKTSDIIGRYADEFKNFTVSDCHVYSKNFENFLSDVPRTSSKHNIYIFDVSLGSDMNGIDLARKIREFDFDGYIIFLTAYEEYVGKIVSYNLKAVNYITKNDRDFEDKLNATLSSIVYETSKSSLISLKGNSIQSQDTSLTFSYKGVIHKINTNDILYVETHPLRRCLNIYLKDSIIEYRETLNKINELLPDHFVRCHKSYIINMSKVERIHIDQQNYIAYIDKHRSCPISKRFVDKPLELLSTYTTI